MDESSLLRIAARVQEMVLETIESADVRAYLNSPSAKGPFARSLGPRLLAIGSALLEIGKQLDRPSPDPLLVYKFKKRSVQNDRNRNPKSRGDSPRAESRNDRRGAGVSRTGNTV